MKKAELFQVRIDGKGKNLMKTLFAPGCALKAYKPYLISKMEEFLTEAGIIDGIFEPCCKSDFFIREETVLIDCCPGCRHMFSACSHIHPISLWKMLPDTSFPFPDYEGREMTIHDACHARERNSSEMQDAARVLCKRMHIRLTEPERTGNETPCCGGCSGDKKIRRQMACERAEELPMKDVVLYCTGCVRSFSVTEARPHHLLDLLFSEPTEGLTLKSR